MYAKPWTITLAPALLLPFFLSSSSAATVCDASFYGNPSPSDCTRILLGNRAEGIRGLSSLDYVQHLFYAGDLDQSPPDVTAKEWQNRVHLAMTLSRGEWKAESMCECIELTTF